VQRRRSVEEEECGGGGVQLYCSSGLARATVISFGWTAESASQLDDELYKLTCPRSS
jgi:hypothetical protein